MYNPLSLFIGLRYTRARKRSGFISFISFISITGIALGIAVLITVLSVINGFHTEMRERILGTVAHINITESNAQLTDWHSLKKIIDKKDYVSGSAPYIEGQVMLVNGSRVSGANIRGILPEYESSVTSIVKEVVSGDVKKFEKDSYRIILGSKLASYLGVYVGDKITVITPNINSTPLGVVPRFRRFTVEGVFNLDMHQYDRNLAVIGIEDASNLFQIKNAVTGLRVKVDDLFKAPWHADKLRDELSKNYFVFDWSQYNSNFFKALQMEKTMLFILMTLVVLVAVFNVVSTLFMVVTDKRSDIAILMTMGMTPSAVRKIFVLQGLIVGSLGILLGVAGGILLSLNLESIASGLESLLGFKFFKPEVYFISSVPSELHLTDVVLVAFISLILSFLATLYPSSKAAAVRPAQALRYE
jgi:lipoprotein-releasing system permease protein